MQLTQGIVNAETLQNIISPRLPPRYLRKPNKFVWKRPFPRSQRRQGFVHGRAAGSLQPRRRLRGSEATPLPSGESCALPGVSGAARPALAAAVPPPAASALPASFLRAGDGDRRVLESPGWSRAKGCNRYGERSGPVTAGDFRGREGTVKVL